MDRTLLLALGGVALAVAIGAALGKGGTSRARGGSTLPGRRVESAEDVNAAILADPNYQAAVRRVQGHQGKGPTITIEEWHRRWGV